ncbi:MAG: hypothetical protein NT147_03085 [Candidatus Aminicenantes bacterium]|nr:hypothetical protein [Candidatus Aminicenantes bacterium]
MIGLNGNCDECRGGIFDGDAAYCSKCWEIAQREIDDLMKRISQLKAEVDWLTAQLDEAATP